MIREPNNQRKEIYLRAWINVFTKTESCRSRSRFLGAKRKTPSSHQNPKFHKLINQTRIKRDSCAPKSYAFEQFPAKFHRNTQKQGLKGDRESKLTDQKGTKRNLQKHKKRIERKGDLAVSKRRNLAGKEEKKGRRGKSGEGEGQRRATKRF